METKDLELALANSTWVRELARQLVRDEDRAEDLVQEAYVVALARPGRVRTSVRGWMHAVMRNLLREAARKDSRRKAREVRSASQVDAPSTLSVVEKLAVHRQVQDVVLSLKPVYREVIYLRYFEDLPPSGIARSLAVPVSTVKTRLDRAIKQMRVALDAKNGGDRRAWAVPLAASLARWNTAHVFGWVAAAVVVLAISVSVAVTTASVPSSSRPAPAGTVVAAAAPAEGAVLDPTGDPTRRFLEPFEGLVRPLPPLLGAPRALGQDTVRGQVIGLGGSRHVAVEVKFLPASGFPSDAVCNGVGVPRDLTDVEGFFAIAGVKDRGVILTAGAEFRTLFAGRVGRDSATSEPVVVIGPRRHYRGRVVDESGLAVEGCRVGLELPAGLRSSLGILPEATWELPVHTMTGIDGVFDLPTAAYVEGAHLRAEALGYREGRIELTSELAGPFDIVVRSSKTLEDAIAGIVLDAAGQPADGALVSDGVHVTRADAEGRFYVSRATAGPRPAPLVAVRRGAQPARYEPPADTEEWPELVTLRLGPPPLLIRGRVMDAEGQPLSDVRVWVMDPMLFAHHYRTTGIVQETRIEGAGRDRDPWVLENLCAGREGRMWSPVRTDEEGRFEIGGLQPRDYRIAAMQRGATQIVTAVTPAGASDVELAFSERPEERVLQGRIEFAGGAPAAGVSVGLQWEVLTLRSVRGRTFHARMHRRRTQSDASGLFRLPGVPVGAVTVYFDDGKILPLCRRVPARADDLVVVVDRRVHVQVVAETIRADAVAFLDERDRAVHCHLVQSGRQIESVRASLVRGRSPVVALPAAAARVLFFAAGRQVASMPISPLPGRLNSVRR